MQTALLAWGGEGKGGGLPAPALCLQPLLASRRGGEAIVKDTREPPCSPTSQLATYCNFKAGHKSEV